MSQMFSTVNQKRVKCHPITQSHIDLPKLQTDNLKTIDAYVGTNSEPLL